LNRVWFQWNRSRGVSAAIGVKAPFPGFAEPALATSIEKVPAGYRVQVHLANEAVQVFTRRSHDWTDRFKKIADDAWHIDRCEIRDH
jgi:bifunctional non-homologous end joining protein LigD